MTGNVDVKLPADPTGGAQPPPGPGLGRTPRASAEACAHGARMLGSPARHGRYQSIASVDIATWLPTCAPCAAAAAGPMYPVTSPHAHTPGVEVRP